MEKDKPLIRVVKNGPYIVTGRVPLDLQSILSPPGQFKEWVLDKTYPPAETYALCRCGASTNHPFCDGSHVACGFDGEEEASREPFFEEALWREMSGITLVDHLDLCSYSRFCHVPTGGNIWKILPEGDDPEVQKTIITCACGCPAGRLVVIDQATGEAIEPVYTPAISATQDPPRKVSGPLWVRGGIQLVAADGYHYELRNRMTLCRCGKSHNMPFCDASHVREAFRDDDLAIDPAPLA